MCVRLTLGPSLRFVTVHYDNGVGHKHTNECALKSMAGVIPPNVTVTNHNDNDNDDDDDDDDDDDRSEITAHNVRMLPGGMHHHARCRRRRRRRRPRPPVDVGVAAQKRRSSCRTGKVCSSRSLCSCTTHR